MLFDEEQSSMLGVCWRTNFVLHMQRRREPVRMLSFESSNRPAWRFGCAYVDPEFGLHMQTEVLFDAERARRCNFFWKDRSSSCMQTDLLIYVGELSEGRGVRLCSSSDVVLAIVAPGSQIDE